MWAGTAALMMTVGILISIAPIAVGMGRREPNGKELLGAFAICTMGLGLMFGAAIILKAHPL